MNIATVMVGCGHILVYYSLEWLFKLKPL